MLRQRVLTALVLGPLAIWGILALPTWGFALVLAVLMGLGAWEWSRLSHLHSLPARLAYTIATVGMFAVLYSPLLGSRSVSFALLAAALVWWCAAAVWVVRFPLGSSTWRETTWAPALAGWLVLVPAWAALTALHATAGPPFVLLLMLLVWGADVGAFFSGKRWGQRKLAPRVSPGKTWEGLAGALAAAVAVALAGAWSLDVPSHWRSAFVALCLVTVLASVLGDLMESMFKRLADVKDSGRLLPGHGGVLDRIDSITAAAPVFVGALAVLGVTA